MKLVLHVDMYGAVLLNRCYFSRNMFVKDLNLKYSSLILYYNDRLSSSQNASMVSGGGFLSWGCKFKYTGRTEREMISEDIKALRQQINAFTSPSKRKAKSVPVTPSSPQGDLSAIQYSSLPRSTISEPAECYDSSAFCPENTLPLLAPVQENTIRHTALRNDLFSESYFKDSFESSSESGLTSLWEVHSGSCYTFETLQNNCKVLKMNTYDIVNNLNSLNNIRNFKNFSIVHVFVLSFSFVLIMLLLLIIFILETESDIFKKVQNLPELMCFKNQYYQPIREYIRRKVEDISIFR